MPSDKQINRWLIGATIAPLIMVSAGEPWPWLLLITLMCGIASYFSGSMGRWGSILQWAAALVTLAILLPQAQQCWPTDPHPAVPLIVLGLATWSAGKGLRAVVGVGCVLFWFIIIMYSGMLVGLIPDIRAENVMSYEGVGSCATVLLLLIPAAPLGTGKRKSVWIIGLIATVASLVSTAAVSGSVETTFYEAIRGVKIRLEPVLGAATTVGWYLIITVLQTIAGESLARFYEKIRMPAIFVSATFAAVVLLCGLYIPAWIGLIIVAISWVILPSLTQLLESRKKMKKSEKNA